MVETDATTRRGRWRTGEQSRERILRAAAARFTEHGFHATTVRAVAADAGVDPGMLRYFFGDKQRLYDAALCIAETQDPIADLLPLGIEGLGHRLVVRVVEIVDSPDLQDQLGLFSAPQALDETQAERMRSYVERVLVVPLSAKLKTEDATLRARLVGAQLIALAKVRRKPGMEPVSSASAESIASWFGPLVQQLLTGPLAPTPDQWEDPAG